MLRKRVEVLFDEKEYRQLEEVAKVRQRSVGSVIREAVEKYVVNPEREKKRKALEWIRAQDIGPAGSPEEIKEEILKAMDEAIEKSPGGIARCSVNKCRLAIDYPG